MKKVWGCVVMAVLVGASGVMAQAVSNRQQVFFFKQVFRNKTKLGILCNKALREADLNEIDIAAMSYQVWSKAANVRSEGDVGSALRDLLNKEKVDAVMLLADPVLQVSETRKYIIQECMLKRIPVVGDSPESVQDGAIYALSLRENKVVPLLNLKAAAALGVQVPQEILDVAEVLVQP